MKKIVDFDLAKHKDAIESGSARALLRDGTPVRIVDYSWDTYFPIIGKKIGDSPAVPITWTKYGNYTYTDKSDNDLVVEIEDDTSAPGVRLEIGMLVQTREDMFDEDIYGFEPLPGDQISYFKSYATDCTSLNFNLSEVKERLKDDLKGGSSRHKSGLVAAPYLLVRVAGGEPLILQQIVL